MVFRFPKNDFIVFHIEIQEHESFVNIYEARNYAGSAEFHLARINITTPALKLEFCTFVSIVSIFDVFDLLDFMILHRFKSYGKRNCGGRES